MLPMQVQYWNLQEAKRHNLVSERQTDDYNREVKRHNVVGEQETHRHNVAGEQLGWANLAETTRHNKASESIGWSTLQETSRHNMSQESIARESNAIAQYRADTERARTATQNRYDVARARLAMAEEKYTEAKTGLVPYEQWKTIGSTAESFSHAVKNVVDSGAAIWEILH